MPATPTQTLITYATCYLCLPSTDQGEAVQLALWDMIAQTISPSPPPDPNNKLTLTPAVGAATVIDNPTGSYDFTGQDVLTAVALNCPNLTGLAFDGNVTQVATLTITGCPMLGNISILNSVLTSLDLTGASTAFTSLTLSDNFGLATVDASLIQTISGNLTLSANDSLTSFLSDALTSSGIITITGCPSLPSLGFSALTNISTQLTVSNNASITDLGMNSVTFCGAITIQQLGSLSNLEFINLATVPGVIDIEQMLNLTQIDLSALTSISSPFTVNDCPNLTIIALTALAVIQAEFTVTSCTALPSLDIPSLASPFDGDVTIQNNDSLVTFTMNSQPWENNGENLFFSNNALDETTVDLILQSGVDGGMTSGTIDTSGGTASAPSVGGLANKSLLILAGVSVTTN